MNIKFFIDRPVLSTVISICIVIAGIIGAFNLPVETYPDIAPPTIMVMANYPGASADAVQKSVISPLEESINGVEDMMYMTSSATNSGSATVNIYFKQGTDPDMAAVNVQNRVSRATGLLPAEVNQIGVQTIKRQTSMLCVLSLTSPNKTHNKDFLSNYMKITMRPDMLRISGVGDVMTFGADYSMRIWLKPDVMAQHHLIPSDITGVLAEQNIEMAAGQLGENSDQTNQYIMRYKGRLEKVSQFEDIVISSLPTGEILRLKDVAKIELGSSSYDFYSETNGAPSVTAMVFQMAGSNATAVNKQIEDYLAQAEKSLPKDVKIVILTSTNDYLFASISEVLKSLIIAIILVILVVYFFLQDFRTTLIPAVAIIVSLVGTFAFLALAGFSINTLTLFALVLAIGTVVDDAIVVVEAVQSRFDIGYKSPYKASVDAMKGLVSPIITTSIVFMAVFIPVAFIGGTSGTFYTQFGITMAVAVAISTINALTMSPVLCALVLKPNPEQLEGGKMNFAARVRIAYNTGYGSLAKKYRNAVLFIIQRKWIAVFLLIAAFLGLYFLMNNTKTGLVPDEDQGFLMVNVSTDPGSSLKQTHKTMDQVEQRLTRIPEIDKYAKVTGYGIMAGQGSTYGTFFVRLKDWEERQDKKSAVQAVLGKIYGYTADINNATIFAIAPGMIPGYGMGNGFELHLQNRSNADVTTFFNNAQQFIGQLNAQPEVSMAFSSFNINFPQYIVEVDAATCKRAGVSPRDVLSTLGGYCGGIYASNFNRFSKIYRVMVQAESKYRMTKEALNNIYVRNGSEMAPISQFIKLTKVNGPEILSRFNMYPSITINGMVAPNYSTGEALNSVKKLAANNLPRGYSYEFGGISREESKKENTTMIIFAICFLFVYLILCALYESFFIPLAVILAVPFGLLGSFMFAKVMGLENNIYMQTGLIMLIGLLAKTAILLTEYATERREKGMSLTQAAYSAAKERLRPILMTALTMVFGMLPLMFASGVGANGNRSLGTTVVGGMLIGTIAILLLVPVFFIFFQKIQEHFKPIHLTEVTDRLILKEIEEIESLKRKKELNDKK